VHQLAMAAKIYSDEQAKIQGPITIDENYISNVVAIHYIINMDSAAKAYDGIKEQIKMMLDPVNVYAPPKDATPPATIDDAINEILNEKDSA
jgi:hypothetical protein